VSAPDHGQPPPVSPAGSSPEDLQARIAAVLGAAEDPIQAAGAVVEVVREFGRPTPVGSAYALAEFLAAAAAHLRAHPGLCQVNANHHGELQLATGQRASAAGVADWATSLHTPIELSPWNSDGAAKAEITTTFPGAPPVGVRVWDVLPEGSAELLGAHQRVVVEPDRLRAWWATHSSVAGPEQGHGGSR